MKKKNKILVAGILAVLIIVVSFYGYYVDCDKNRQECLSAGVTGYPTWKINGQNYPGEQSIGRLAQLS
ncbi:hypothetical protein J4232_01660 [Candidatus Woesearchaeota archaeon]|nr:hypothetical protein [Candidatus Woesearchaeota archaeon]